ncbi:hypothetical protein Bbelb_347800 [Branchiostoma belcheri]|nr:hypothetical protein Bbelb_347800 [Branchiostoma belcheri]
MCDVTDKLTGQRGHIRSGTDVTSDHCEWDITTDPDRIILINFDRGYFRRGSDGCQTEVLTFYDGGTENSRMVDTFCRGQDGPLAPYHLSVASTGHQLHVVLTRSPSAPWWTSVVWYEFYLTFTTRETEDEPVFDEKTFVAQTEENFDERIAADFVRIKVSWLIFDHNYVWPYGYRTDRNILEFYLAIQEHVLDFALPPGIRYICEPTHPETTLATGEGLINDSCEANDARNRLRSDVACRPHSYTLRNRASDVRRRHSFPTTFPRDDWPWIAFYIYRPWEENVAIMKYTYWNVKVGEENSELNGIECVVNGQRFPIEVIVKVHPEVRISPSTSELNDLRFGQELQLNCTAYNFRVNNFNWFLNGVPVNRSLLAETSDNSSSVLYIHSLLPTYEGHVTCEAGSVGGDQYTDAVDIHIAASVTTRRTCFCVLSTCKNVGKRKASVRVAIAQRSYVVSTFNSLTTCATYDARNRSRPDVARRPHSYILRNRASDVRVTCVDATPSPRCQDNVWGEACDQVCNCSESHTCNRTLGCVCYGDGCSVSQTVLLATSLSAGGLILLLLGAIFLLYRHNNRLRVGNIDDPEVFQLRQDMKPFAPPFVGLAPTPGNHRWCGDPIQSHSTPGVGAVIGEQTHTRGHNTRKIIDIKEKQKRTQNSALRYSRHYLGGLRGHTIKDN